MPPVFLLPLVIRHLAECKAEGTLIVPGWFLSLFGPQRLVRLHLVGEYVPFFPLGGFLDFRIRHAQSLYPGWYLFALFFASCILVELCKVTRTALNSKAHGSRCTPTSVYES